MKRISLLLLAAVTGLAPALVAQDAATEERLNQLNAKVEELQAALVLQQKRLADLAQELQNLREQQNRPGPAFATADDLKRLAEKIQELDRKREADKELILREIEKLAKTAAAPPRATRPAAIETPPPVGDDKGFEYVIQPGDTLSLIVQAYREKNIKVTVKQILQANPGLDEKKLKVGQKIFIPAPKS